MDFKQLEAFVYVVKLGSFSKAAEAIFLSQPTISAHIQSLESHLNTQLLVRSKKEVFPTKAGAVLYDYALNMLALRDNAVYSVNALTESAKGEIEIFASSVPAQYMLPDVVTSFSKEYPLISFYIRQMDSSQVVDAVAGGKCEFGILGTQIENHKCTYEPFVKDKLVIITPNTEEYSCLPAEDKLLDFFYEHPFIMRELGSGTRLESESFLYNLGVDPKKLRVVAHFTNTQSVIHAVSKQLGISIVSSLAADCYRQLGLICVHEIENQFLYREFSFIFKKEALRAPISDIFIDFVKTYYKGH